MSIFEDIELAFYFVNSAPYGSNNAYLDRETGQIFYESALGDSDELPDGLDNGTRYVCIPHRNDLDVGRRLVEKFVQEHMPTLSEEVRAIFQHGGAYSRFKSLLQTQGLVDTWHAFEEEASMLALRIWCEGEGLLNKPI